MARHALIRHFVGLKSLAWCHSRQIREKGTASAVYKLVEARLKRRVLWVNLQHPERRERELLVRCCVLVRLLFGVFRVFYVFVLSLGLFGM